LRLISPIKSEPFAWKILTAMHLPADVPELHPDRRRGPTGSATGGLGDAEDYVN
jgi:hypothetical protein